MMTPPPASREVSLRVGHNAALPATGGHSLPRCRFATPPGGSLSSSPAEIRYPISDFAPRSYGSLPEGDPPAGGGGVYRNRHFHSFKQTYKPKFELPPIKKGSP